MKIATGNISNLSKLEQSTAIFSPRSSFKSIIEEDDELLADLTLNFDRFTINVLKQEFIERKNQLTLLEFILVVRGHLVSWQSDLANREVKIVRCLIKLFYEIDLNNNKTLEWQQFTNYIIEKATVLKSIKLKHDEIKSYSRSSVRPKEKFNCLIPKVIYLEHHDRLAFFEEARDKIYFMNPENGVFDRRTLVVEPKQLVIKTTNNRKDVEGKRTTREKDFVIHHKTHILDILYIPDERYRVILTSSQDRYVRGWRHTNSGYVVAQQPENQEQLIEHKFSNEIYSMGWDSNNEILYCGDNDGNITKWNLKMDTQRLMEVDARNKHEGIITDILTMPKLQFMASAGIDGKLILWDTINNSVKWVYKKHTRAILSLAFNENLILLFSAGFDHQICIWNPYISELIHRMVGSSSPFLAIKVIEGTNQFVTLSADGTVRLADMKRFNFISSFSIESSDAKHKFNPLNFTYIRKPLRLAFCGRSIELHEYDKNYNPSTVDDCMATNCRFLPSNMSFFTPTGTRVKQWNALTGDISKIYSQMAQTDITAFEFDQLRKRMIIGESCGLITIFNIMNGARLNTLPRHNAEVIGIIHCQLRDSSSAIFITGGMDNRIIITIDNYYGECIPIREIMVGEGAFLTTFCYCSLSRSIVLGTSLGSLGYYESETGKLLGITNNSAQYEEITTVQILDSLPFILACYSSGKIYVIAMPPLMAKFQKVFYWVNKDHEKPAYSSTVTLLAFNSSRKWLYTCDDKLFLKAYDMSQLCRDLEKYRVEESDKYNNSERFTRVITSPIVIGATQVPVCWVVKLQNEILRSFSFVAEQNLLITSSYDKKVKIWDSNTGEYIDSLQQNYDKKEPRPIAYRRNGTTEIYKPNLEDRVDKEFVCGASPVREHELSPFDPFSNYDNIELSLLPWTISNSQWRLRIDIKKYYKEYFQDFNKTYIELRRYQDSLNRKKKSSRKKKVSFGHIREMLTYIEKGHHPADKAGSELARVRSTENFQGKEDPKSKIKFTKKERQMLQSISIERLRLKSPELKRKEFEEHKRQIQILHRKETKAQFLARTRRKVVLSPEQALAAERLGKALGEVQPQTMVDRFVPSIELKRRGSKPVSK